MKILLLIVTVIMMIACSPKKTDKEFSEDYVLIEFASKLEEDYHRMNKTPYGSSHAHPPVKDIEVGDEILIEEMHDQ